MFVTCLLFLSSLKTISANHRSDYCHDFSRNCGSVVVSDEITVSLISLLKVICKIKLSISVESLYRFKENQKGRKRSDTHTLQNSRQNLSFERVRSPELRDFVFKTHFLVRDDKHVILQAFARYKP